MNDFNYFLNINTQRMNTSADSTRLLRGAPIKVSHGQDKVVLSQNIYN